MIIEAAENDLVPVCIKLMQGTRQRDLQYTPAAENGDVGTYECLQFVCTLNTKTPEAGSVAEDSTPGVYTFRAETEKSASGANGGSATSLMTFFIPLKAIGAVAGRYPFEVRLLTYNEATAGSPKGDDTLVCKNTVCFAEDNTLVIHGEVKE